MSYTEFYEDFKNNKLRSAIFLYGEEDFLIDWAKDLIINRYIDVDNRSYDVVEFDGDKCDAAEISQAARSYSMFSDKRVVIINNYPSIYRKSGIQESADDELLLELINEEQDSSVIILTLEAKYYQDIKAYGKKIAKAFGYEFNKLDRNGLKAWINKRLHANGKIIGRREMDYIVDLSGYCNRQSDYHLKNMASDIVKLCNATEGDDISQKLIEEILVGAEDKFVFNLIDALVDGNKNKAMELAAAIVAEDDGSMMVLSLLTKQFEIMYDALELSESGMSISKMASATGTNEYRFKKAYNAARRFNGERLKELLIRLYDIDKDIKSGNMDKDIALELFVASI